MELPGWSPPPRIGEYRLVRRLGGGAMGQVFLATDELLHREVALKFINVLEPDPTQRERLLVEARAAARLSHPNVLAVHRVGELDGVPYIVAEFVHGQSLDRLARPLPWPRVLDLGLGLARGLAAAHRVGVLHRDLKPANAILGEDGVVKILDFGLAKLMEPRAQAGPAAALSVQPEAFLDPVAAGPMGGETVSFLPPELEAPAHVGVAAGLTGQGAILGTPWYMSPEAWRGAAQTSRSDVYSLGAVLFELLTGAPPFGDLASNVLASVVQRMDAPTVVTRVADVPPGLAAVIDRCLRRDPAARFASGDDVREALERLAERPSYASARSDVPAPAAPVARARRWWMIPLAIAVGAAIVVLAWLELGGGAARSLAVPPTCPAPALPLLYVAADAAPGGNGSQKCPFRTVSEALALAAPRRVIHIGAGRYDAGHGEQLPLVVRGATELRGAGPDATVIAGVGYFDPQPDALAAAEHPVRATLVIGDAAADVVLAGLSVESGQSEIKSGDWGVVCTRGNLDRFDRPVPAPNTRLERIAIGSGYENGLVVTGGSQPRLSGCNLSVTGGLFHDSSAGIWQVGCGGLNAAPTALHVDKSSFRGLRSRDGIGWGTGVGVLVWDCASGVHVENSLFADSEIGVQLIRHAILQPNAGRAAEEPPALIEHNELRTLSGYGISLAQSPYVELSGNSIYETNGPGIAINIAPGEAARVRARANYLARNTMAVDVRGIGTIARGTVIDFGTASDPGRNAFSCNASLAGAAGGTVVVGVPSEPGVSLEFRGNRWDHVPLRVHRGARRHGDEVLLAAQPAPAIDLGDAEPTGKLCRTEP